MSLPRFHPFISLLVLWGARSSPKPPASLDITTEALPDPEWIDVSTRHGSVRCLVYRPLDAGASDRLPPVILHIHGGAFIVRHPEQDNHLVRYLAAKLGAVVVLPDYETAPKVEYPVAEEQVFDVAIWMRGAGASLGRDADRMAVSGASAGAKLAINVCQQLHAQGLPKPRAAALIVPVTDATRTDRRSPTGDKAAISPLVQKGVLLTYFADAARRREPLASPRFDAGLAAAMPATLIQTAQDDTLSPEGRELAETLQAGGVETRFHEFAGVDHGFAAEEPVAPVREALEEIVSFLEPHLT